MAEARQARRVAVLPLTSSRGADASGGRSASPWPGGRVRPSTCLSSTRARRSRARSMRPSSLELLAPPARDPKIAKLSPSRPSTTGSRSPAGRRLCGPRLRRARRRLPPRTPAAAATASRRWPRSIWAKSAAASPQRRPRVRRKPSLEAATRACAEEAELVLRLSDVVMRSASQQEGLREVFESMELPLVEVLAEMEQTGVKVDRELLAQMSRDLERQIQQLTTEIHCLAGGEFNVNSPAQLREILFERLGLRQGKKTAKTRAASTAEDGARGAGARARPAPQDPRLPHPSRSSSRPTWMRCPSSSTRRRDASTPPSTRRWPPPAASPRATPTSRTSRSAPAAGRRIREAFVAEPGHLLLSADYSQIELQDPGPPVPGQDADRDLRAGRRRPRPHPARSSGPSRLLLAGRAAAALEDDQLRAALREDGLHAGPGPRRQQARGRASSSRPTSRATRVCGVSSTRRSPKRTPDWHVRTLLGRLRRPARDQLQDASRCGWRPSARRATPRCRGPRPT